jgi:hypothetical protein
MAMASQSTVIYGSELAGISVRVSCGIMIILFRVSIDMILLKILVSFLRNLHKHFS